jgi:hypothetical protein
MSLRREGTLKPVNEMICTHLYDTNVLNAGRDWRIELRNLSAISEL